jgi:hypothetical protein
MYYPDLTPYSYRIRYPNHKVLNVGWLDRAYAFPRAQAPGLVDKLLPYALHSIEPTLGWHSCPLCDAAMPSMKWRNETVDLGTSEIRVLIDDVWYASPTLVVHYIHAHQYSPPLEFIRACFHGPDPTSQEYADALYDLQRSVGPERYTHADMGAMIGAYKFGTTPPPHVAAKMKDRWK